MLGHGDGTVKTRLLTVRQGLYPKQERRAPVNIV